MDEKVQWTEELDEGRAAKSINHVRQSIGQRAAGMNDIFLECKQNGTKGEKQQEGTGVIQVNDRHAIDLSAG